jgi:hypothetical protein
MRGGLCMNTKEVVVGRHENEDAQLAQSELTNRNETQSGFQLLKDHHVAGLGPCLRWTELLGACTYAGSQVVTRIVTEPYPMSLKETDDQARDECCRLRTLLSAHQKNCSQCRVFPQVIPECGVSEVSSEFSLSI